MSWARAAALPLAALTGINVLNYVDRYLIAAMLPSIQGELSLSDDQAGWFGFAFILVYLLTSPLFGWLGDRGARKVWIALGVAIWSVATGLGGVARGFWSLLVARATVGVGEAAYGTIAPSLLADLVPRARRGIVMSIFCLAIPVGSALGYLLGGVLGEHLGWRPAFFVVGFPGVLLAGAVLFLREPRRGVHDADNSAPPPFAQAYLELLRNRLYLWTVLGYTAYTFALGGLAFWMPSYMMRERGYGQVEGMLYFGGTTVVTGTVGTLVGGWLGDRLLPVTRKAYTWIGVVAVALGALFTLAAFHVESRASFLLLLAVAELMVFLNTGPVNALIVNAVRPAVRATAVAVSIFTIHLLGDAISPVLIGVISSRTNLTTGMLAIPGVFLVAAFLWATTLPRRRGA